MVRLALALVSTGLFLLGPLAAEARADCAAPRVTVAPRSGAVVPTDPVLHVFVPTWMDRKDRAAFEVMARGEPLRIKAAQVSHSDAFVTYRIAIETRGASAIELRQGEASLATYAIDLTWKGRDRGTVIVPRDHEDLFGGDRDGDGRIGLGHLSCLGATVPEDQLGGPLEVCIAPLHPDGSSGSARCSVLGGPTPPPPFEEVDDGMVVTACPIYLDPIPPALPAAAAPGERRPFALWTVIAGLLLAGLVLGRRLRRLMVAAGPGA